MNTLEETGTVTPTPEPQPPQPARTGTFPYGWDAEPYMLPVLVDGVPQKDAGGNPKLELVKGKFIKKFTHPFRTIISGSPKRGPWFANIVPTTKRQQKRHSESKLTRYIVWSDHSLRRLDKTLAKAVSEMSPEQRVALVTANAKGAQ